MTNDADLNADPGQTPWQWSLLADIELLEELLTEHREFLDADDALAVHAVALNRALRLRRDQWRATSRARQVRAAASPG